MVERNTKKLLLEALNKTGDNPEDVNCMYSRGFLHYDEGPPPMKNWPSCLGANLPEGELSVLFCYSEKYSYRLVRKGKGPQIETSPNTDPS